jgi:hypothetical protein
MSSGAMAAKKSWGKEISNRYCKKKAVVELGGI